MFKEWTIAVAKAPKTDRGTAATIGYEAELWRMADALRGSMNAAEYKHVVPGLIFLKYISDAFESQHATLEAERDQGAAREDLDEYRALNIFWVAARGALVAPEGPGEAIHHRPVRRRSHGRHRARQPLTQGCAAQGLRLLRARLLLVWWD